MSCPGRSIWLWRGRKYWRWLTSDTTFPESMRCGNDRDLELPLAPQRPADGVRVQRDRAVDVQTGGALGHLGPGRRDHGEVGAVVRPVVDAQDRVGRVLVPAHPLRHVGHGETAVGVVDLVDAAAVQEPEAAVIESDDRVAEDRAAGPPLVHVVLECDEVGPRPVRAQERRQQADTGLGLLQLRHGVLRPGQRLRLHSVHLAEERDGGDAPDRRLTRLQVTDEPVHSGREAVEQRHVDGAVPVDREVGLGELPRLQGAGPEDVADEVAELGDGL